MNNGNLNWIANFIWGIADDVLRGVYVRGKYRDVILPMTVIRRLDAVLEPTKQAVLGMKQRLDEVGITNQAVARLAEGSGEELPGQDCAENKYGMRYPARRHLPELPEDQGQHHHRQKRPDE
jgi:type I restriction-modification system DNA methylase subunit